MHGFNWLTFLYDKITHENIHVVSAALVAFLLILGALIARRNLIKMESSLVPADRFTLTNLFEILVENLLNLMEGVMGPDARKYFPLLATIFIYIFTCNLMGVIPGFVPPTDNVNTNAAIAVCVFVYYNYMGIKEHGIVNYVKHFMGPIWWLAPLMLVIELISHIVRPVSLSLRLFGNITGDHLVLGIFSDLVPLVIPVIFMMLGIFVAFIQAFVFTLLSMIYIVLATAHEEH